MIRFHKRVQRTETKKINAIKLANVFQNNFEKSSQNLLVQQKQWSRKR